MLRQAQAVARLGSWRIEPGGPDPEALEWSAETYRLFGVPPGSRMTYPDFLDRIYPEDRERVVAAFEDALKVQAGAVANIEGTRTAVNDLVTASQSATGALQAAQAGNQLLAVQSQQLADLIASVTSLGRAQTLDAANSAAAKAQAREQLRRFLAPGRGYVPTTAQMFRN